MKNVINRVISVRMTGIRGASLACYMLPNGKCNEQADVTQKPSEPDDTHISQDEIAILMYNIMFCDTLGGIEE